jgi:hypothetical protein
MTAESAPLAVREFAVLLGAPEPRRIRHGFGTVVGEWTAEPMFVGFSDPPPAAQFCFGKRSSCLRDADAWASCVEVEITKRLRATGWSGGWLNTSRPDQSYALPPQTRPPPRSPAGAQRPEQPGAVAVVTAATPSLAADPEPPQLDGVVHATTDGTTCLVLSCSYVIECTHDRCDCHVCAPLRNVLDPAVETGTGRPGQS